MKDYERREYRYLAKMVPACLVRLGASLIFRTMSCERGTLEEFAACSSRVPKVPKTAMPIKGWFDYP